MTKLLLLAAAIAQPGFDECPHSLVSKGHDRSVAVHTRAYTECMTIPRLPTGDELASRLRTCAPVRTRVLALGRSALSGDPDYRFRSDKAARAAASPLDWIDHIAANFPGCETDIHIKGDGSELPHAEH